METGNEKGVYTLYACLVGLREFPKSPGLCFRLEPWPVSPNNDDCRPSERHNVTIETPLRGEVVDGGFSLRYPLPHGDADLTTNEVFAFARHKMHGFRTVSDGSAN